MVYLTTPTLAMKTQSAVLQKSCVRTSALGYVLRKDETDRTTGSCRVEASLLQYAQLKAQTTECITVKI